MKQRGRKSIDSLTVTSTVADISRPKPPGTLEKPSAKLWDRILASYPPNHFNAADLELLREFCHTSGTLLPRVNKTLEKGPDLAVLRARAALVKEAAALATKLRLCMSARTRGDLASVRDAGRPGGVEDSRPWED